MISQVHELLEQKYAQFNQAQFIETDPISVPHTFTEPRDIEIAGFFAAILAWGQRPTILKNANQLMRWMDLAPYAFIREFKPADTKPFQQFVHRTFNGHDCINFLYALKQMYAEYGSLEQAFQLHQATPDNFGEKIHQFRTKFIRHFKQTRTNKHISDPLANSSAKRICMYLRWMVRKDAHGVDFGIWESVSPHILHAPLDLHSGRIARQLGLLTRKQDDWKAVQALTGQLRIMCPADPIKYDFALYGLGAFDQFHKL